MKRRNRMSWLIGTLQLKHGVATGHVHGMYDETIRRLQFELPVENFTLFHMPGVCGVADDIFRPAQIPI